MNWKELSKNTAKFEYEKINIENCILTPKKDIEYEEIRNEIQKAFKQVLVGLNINENELCQYVGKYKFDCRFAKEIYRIFNTGKYLMGTREASNDNIWRYIQLYIVPDIIVYRWGKNCENRMYSESKRIYLKVLWWYYHLSFKENYDKTLIQLLNPCNSSDTIVQLVERCGKNGYRIEVYREIMKQKTERQIDTRKFRTLMKLNSAKINILNPFLMDNGVPGYVTMLIDAVEGE